ARSDAGLLLAGGRLIGAPAARVPALRHAGRAVLVGRVGGEAREVELVAVGAHLERGPAPAVERRHGRGRIVEGAEHVAREVPVAHRAAGRLAVVEAAVLQVGLGPGHAVAVVAVERPADEGLAHGRLAHPRRVERRRPAGAARDGRARQEEETCEPHGGGHAWTSRWHFDRRSGPVASRPLWPIAGPRRWTGAAAAVKSTRAGGADHPRRTLEAGAMSYTVAVVGATGNVGREMLSILAERHFPAGEVFALASRRSNGVEVSFGDKTLKCKDLATFDFSKVDFCLMSAGGAVSKEWSPRIAAKGCVVIDNSSAWRYDQDVPLVVPEVNADAVAGYARKNIIANPNCSTAQMVVALKPLHDRATIKRVVVSTYQSVSGAGKEAMDELWSQTKGKYVPGQEYEPKKFPKEIAFNCIPHVDVFMEDGYTREEWKMVAETKKILDPRI